MLHKYLFPGLDSGKRPGAAQGKVYLGNITAFHLTPVLTLVLWLTSKAMCAINKSQWYILSRSGKRI